MWLRVRRSASLRQEMPATLASESGRSGRFRSNRASGPRTLSIVQATFSDEWMTGSQPASVMQSSLSGDGVAQGWGGSALIVLLKTHLERVRSLARLGRPGDTGGVAGTRTILDAIPPEV